MKKFFLLLLVIASNVFAAPNQSVLNIIHWKTKNNANVYFVREPEIPIIDIAVVFKAGSAYDGKQWGVASLVNSMLNEGTTKQNADQIADALDSVGAEVTGSVNRDMAVINFRSLVQPKYLNPAVTTFSDLLVHSNFPKTAFNRVKHITLASIKQSEQSPNSIASKAFYQTLYGSYPYAHPVDGTAETVSALTQEAAKTFFHRYYVASNADIVIVGDVTHAQAKKIANQLTASMRQGEPAKKLPIAKANGGGSHHFTSFPSTQDSIILGQLGITFNNPEYFPLVVGNHVLGARGLVSILFEQVRNQRGLAYDVTSTFVPLKYRGPFFIMLQTRAKKTKEAIQLVQNVVQKFIKQGPTEKELEAAKKNLIGSFPLKLSTNQAILANVGRIAFYHLPLDYLDTYRGRVRAVTNSQVITAFQRQIHPDKMKMIIVGPQNNH